MRAVIFAAAKISNLDAVREQLLPDDYIIAADGGAAHCAALDILPAILLGDFDSIDPELLQRMENKGVNIQRFDAKKDETDLELALLHVKDKNIEEVIIFGGIGSRWDQSLASMLLPANVLFQSLSITFWDRGQRLFLIDDVALFHAQPGTLVSLIPIGGHAIGVHTRWLQYPLINEPLYLGSTRGVSNVMLNKKAEVSVQHGLLLCVVGSKD